MRKSAFCAPTIHPTPPPALETGALLVLLLPLLPLAPPLQAPLPAGATAGAAVARQQPARLPPRQQHAPFWFTGRRFARLRSEARAARAQISAAPLDTAVPVDAADLEGANVWLLKYMAEQGGFSVNFSVFRVPQELWDKARTYISSCWLLPVSLLAGARTYFRPRRATGGQDGDARLCAEQPVVRLHRVGHSAHAREAALHAFPDTNPAIWCAAASLSYSYQSSIDGCPPPRRHALLLKQ